MNNNKLFSIIIPSYYSSSRLELSYDKLSEIFAREDIPFELIIIDDGSKDNSYECGIELERKHNNVHAYQLSRNYTAHYAAFAGLSLCNGACAMIIPDDEQQPYSTVVQSYRLWESGSKIVIPYRDSRHDPWKSRIFSLMFYRLMNKYSEVAFPPGGADVFLVDREIINIINTKIHPICTTTITEVLRLGFEPHFLPFERPLGLNNGKTRWSFKKRMKLAKDFFFTSSSVPIKLITKIGLFFSFFSFGLIILYLYIHFFGNQQFWGYSVPGWTSLLLAISFFSGLILFSLGVISEYIWRIYEEVKNRPGYIVKQKDER